MPRGPAIREWPSRAGRRARAAAELPENPPGLELRVRPLAGGAELRVGLIGLLLGFGLVLAPVRDLRVPASLVALVGEGDQAGGFQLGQDAPDPLGVLVVHRAGQRPRRPTRCPR